MAVRISGKPRTRRKQTRSNIGLILISTSILVAALIVRHTSVPAPATVAAPTVVAEFDTVNVPVPARFVPAGTHVRDIEFTQVSYPVHQVPQEALMNLDDALDATTIASLPARLPVFKANLNMKGQSINPVVERIPTGMRAMTLSVDATTAVEGWAGSGAIVDVLLVQKDRTSVIAENVKILSAERSVSPVESVAPSVPKTVTLLVTQEQCLAINTAIPLGKIAFALRGASDTERWNGATYSSDRLKNGGVVKDAEGAITGYVAIKGQDASHAFALSGGKWVKTQVVPEGFFVAGEQHAAN